MDQNLANAVESDAAHWRMKWDRNLRWAMGPPGGGKCFSAEGMLILRRWTGRKYPIPDDGPAAGFALRPASAVSSDTSATYSNNTTYWHLVDTVSPGGVRAPRDPLTIHPAVYDAIGFVGLIPNTPTHVRARQNQASQVIVAWRYNPVLQLAEPATFEIFANDTPTTMDLTTPVASVTYVPGRREYVWQSGVLGDGTLKYYTVRARTAGLVYSLIPQSGDADDGDPLPGFSAMSVNDAARVVIVASAPSKPAAPTFA